MKPSTQEGERRGESSVADPDEGLAASEWGFRLTATILLVGFIVTLASQLPEGLAPAWLHGQRRAYQAIWPQGWSLFAGAPDSESVVAYRVEAGGLPIQVTQRQASVQYMWGLSRGGYAQVAETQAIVRAIPVSQWVRCNEADVGCSLAMTTISPYGLVNRSRQPTLCGRIALMNERPIPWSPGRRPSDPPRRATRVAILRVSCD